MRFTTIFFDLDDTLYPSHVGLWNAIKARMTDYMEERLRIPPTEIPALREKYYLQYGTTLRGLQANHVIDVQDYLAFVHDLPLEGYIRPNPALDAMLGSIPLRKVVFTNASRGHAERVLNCLGVSSRIDAIVDLFALEMANKPEPAAYERALKLAGESDPRVCVLADDLLRNLAPAKALGMTTVLVGPERQDGVADVRIERIADLTRALPGLVARDDR